MFVEKEFHTNSRQGGDYYFIYLLFVVGGVVCVYSGEMHTPYVRASSSYDMLISYMHAVHIIS